MATELDVDDVCRELYPRLVGALGLFCGDGAMGEDLAQEALVRLWERWPTSRRPEHPMAWCYRVGVNLARSAARRRGLEQRLLRRIEAGTQGDDRNEALTRALPVRDAVVALPRRQRQAIVARHFLSLSVEETALAMGCAPGTVTALTHQGVASLRRSDLLAGQDTYEEVEHG
ncbi:MAG: sigma-70 family RNA polymerase sigma factor [Actinomycetota bacterium]|nr:sigma-70 family RNA polymerase sigma factor [Actinomycetota bacterium]